MIMADVLKYLLLVLGAQFVFVAYWLAARALFPDAVHQASDAYGRRPVRITAIGLLVGMPLVLSGVALLNAAGNGGMQLLGGMLIGTPLLVGMLGSAGLSERLGHGLVHADDTHSPWRRSLRGAVILSFTFLLPAVGWFFVLPLTLVSGLGAFVALLWERRRRRGPALPGIA